jgi:acrylyl-CoA reductase (NADPH)
MSEVLFDAAAPVEAFVVSREGGTAHVTHVDYDDLGPGDVTVEVSWSGINYKDALASRPDGRVARLDVLIPGIDLAGSVVSTVPGGPEIGAAVVVHGYDVGVAHHGGFAGLARVPAEWVVPLDGLSPQHAMTIGTAGYTAALCVDALERNGLKPADDAEVLVLGASGGVGSIAITILANRGYRPVAVTGTPAAADWLRARGAVDVLSRAEIVEGVKPLARERWAGCVDPVGGAPLAYALSTLRYGAAVASCGNVGGTALEGSIFPFILRGVALLGVDSVATPIETRRAVWRRLASDLTASDLDALGTTVVDLHGLPDALADVYAGRTVGRTLVSLR